MSQNYCDNLNSQPSKTELYKAIAKESKTTHQLVKNIKQQLQDSQLNVDNGNRFLAFRNNLLLDYLIQLVEYTLLKIDGETIQDHPVISNLFKLRTYIKKTDPVYQKMKYQIEKVISDAESGKLIKNDPLGFKPCPQNLMVDVDSDDEVTSEDENIENDEDDDNAEKDTEYLSKNKEDNKKRKVYVPPKIIPMKYNEDEERNDELKKEKALERAKKKAMSSDIIAELRTEFDEGPEEIVEKTVSRKRPSKVMEEKRRYEEEYMVRLRKTKQDKRIESKQGLMTISSLSSHVTRFDNISPLDINNPDDFKIKKRKVKALPKAKAIKRKNRKRFAFKK